MAKPVVAVVGRPNVGKSTLFNKIIGKRLSIVDDTPGVTRDRIYGDGEWLGKKFMLVDTGGIEPDGGDVILAGMRAQAQLAEAQALHQALRLDGAVVSQQAEVEQRRVPVAPAKQPVDLIGAQDDALFAVPQNISGHDAAPFPFRFNPLAFYFTRNPPRRKAAAHVFSENSAFRQKVLFPAGFCAIINLYSYLQSHAPRRVAVRK